jgi:hypothetical protein
MRSDGEERMKAMSGHDCCAAAMAEKSTGCAAATAGKEVSDSAVV